jgi:predicted Zn-dependent protease
LISLIPQRFKFQHFNRWWLVCGILILPACGTLSIEDERELGKEQVELVAANSNMVTDQSVEQYLEELTTRLLAATEPGPYEIEFRIIDSDAFSAFAVPGGNIYLTKGTIKACRNVSELASILAHEISHVNRGHIRSTYRSFRNSQRAADFAGITLALLTGNPFIAGAGDLAANLGSGVYIGSHSREREREADADAFKIMTAAGFDPRSQLTLLARLQASTIGQETAPQMLMTHPLAEERIAEVRNRLQQQSDLASLEVNDDGRLEEIQTRL